jgi:hypothetical protein
MIGFGSYGLSEPYKLYPQDSTQKGKQHKSDKRKDRSY